MGLETVGALAGAGATAYGAYQARNASNQQTAQQENAITHLYDPTNPMLRNLAEQQVGTLGRVNAGQNIFAQHTNPLQTQGQNAISGLLGYNPEGAANSASFDRLNGMASGALNVQAPNSGFQRVGVSAYQPQSNPYTSQMGVQGYAPNMQMQGAGNVSATSNPFQELQFGRVTPGNAMSSFSGVGGELRNPYALQGFENPGMNAVNAARPVFEQNLRSANTQLANAAPGRFSSAFVDQGIDLNSRAVNDFNMFAGQQLMQGEQLKAQQQAAAQQFMLGARGLAQDATSIGGQQELASQELFQSGQLQARGLQQQSEIDAAGRNLTAQQSNQQTRLVEQQISAELQRLGMDANTANMQAQLQARQLAQGAFGQQQELGFNAQNAFMQNLMGAMAQQLGADGQNQQFALGRAGVDGQNILGALAQMMSNAQAAGAGQFGRASGAMSLGMGATANTINPLLQLMMGGLNYAVPSDLNAIIGGQGIKGQVLVPTGTTNGGPPLGPNGDPGTGHTPNPIGGDGGGDSGYTPNQTPTAPPLQPGKLYTFNNQPHIVQNGQFVPLNMSFDQARQLYGAEIGASNEDVARLGAGGAAPGGTLGLQPPPAPTTQQQAPAPASSGGLFTYNNEPYVMQNGRYVKLNMSFDQARAMYGAERGLSNSDVEGRL